MKTNEQNHFTLDFFNKSNPDERKIRRNERSETVKAKLTKFESNHDYYVMFIEKYCESLYDDLRYLIADTSLLTDISSLFEKIIIKAKKRKYRLVEFFALAEYEALVRTLYSKLENLVKVGIDRKKAIDAIRTGVCLTKRELQSNNRNGNCKEKLVLQDGTEAYEMNTVNGFDFLLILDKHKYLSKEKIALLKRRYTFIFGEVKSTSSYYGSTVPKFLYHTPAFQSANLITKYLTIHGYLNRYLKNNMSSSLSDFRILYNELFELYLSSLNTARLSKQKYKLNRYASPYYLFTKSKNGIPVVLPLDPLQISNTKAVYNFAKAECLFPQGIVDKNFKINNDIYEKFHPEKWPKYTNRKSGNIKNLQVCEETKNLIKKLGLEELAIKEMYNWFPITQGFDHCTYRIDDEIINKNINASLQFISINLPVTYNLLDRKLKLKIQEFERQYHGIVLIDKTSGGKRNLKSCAALAIRNMNHKLPVIINNNKSYISAEGKYLALSKHRKAESLYYLAERLMSQSLHKEFIDDEQFWTKLCIVMSIGVESGPVRSVNILGSNVAISQFSEFHKLPFEVNSPVKTLKRKTKKNKANIIPKHKRRRRRKIGSPTWDSITRYQSNFDVITTSIEDKILWKKALKKMNDLATAFGGRGKYFSSKYFQNLGLVNQAYRQWLVDRNYNEPLRNRLKEIFSIKLEKEVLTI